MLFLRLRLAALAAWRSSSARRRRRRSRRTWRTGSPTCPAKSPAWPRRSPAPRARPAPTGVDGGSARRGARTPAVSWRRRRGSRRRARAALARRVGRRAPPAAAHAIRRAFPNARFLPALRRANVHGALDMGLAPGLLPGRVTLEDGRRGLLVRLGVAAGHGRAGTPAPSSRRPSTTRSRRSSSSVATRSPTARTASSPGPAIEQARTLIFVGTHRNGASALSGVVLPVAGDGERGGTTTNCEGRVTRLAAKVLPPGIAWPAWTVAERAGTPARRLPRVRGRRPDLRRDRPPRPGVPGCRRRPARPSRAPRRRRRAARCRAGRHRRPCGRGRSTRSRPRDPLGRGAGGPARPRCGPAGGAAADGEVARAAVPGDAAAARHVLARRTGPPTSTVRRRAPTVSSCAGRCTNGGRSSSRAPRSRRSFPSRRCSSTRRRCEELGVAPGSLVTVRSARDSLQLPVELDGVAAARASPSLVANLAGPGGARCASALVDAARPATDVWLEKA